MCVVGLLLLIACGNVAQLLLARANTRQREMAMRMALGAGNLRLVRQLMTEGGLLALGGGLLALPLAYWATGLIVAGMASTSSLQFSTLKIQPDLRVLAFTALVSLGTVILFGLAPAVRVIRFNLLPALKEASGAAAQAVPASRVAKALVVSQVALSLILVLGAGLLVRSLRKLQHSNLGFNANNVLLVSIVPDMAGYKGERLNEFDSEVLTEIRMLPGVREASVSMFTPMSAGHIDSEAHIQGYTPRPGEDLAVDVNYVGPKHFQTLDTPVVLGREFNTADNETAPKVALINETMAHRFFGDANPLGRTLRVDDETPLSIVGVVKDAKSQSLREQIHPTAYRPLFQSDGGGQVTFEIRTETDPAQVVSSVQRLLHAADSRVPVRRVETLSQQINDSLLEERMVGSLSSGFGLLALLLANIGLYGLMAYTVKRRTREIGVRVALGARRRDVIEMVLRETLLLVMVGLAVGAPLAAGATRLIASQLYGITAADPPTIAMTTTLMMAVAALAGYLPARRAATVSPMEALRYE
jgi:predicted permease